MRPPHRTFDRCIEFFLLMGTRKIYTVTEINQYVSSIIRRDLLLSKNVEIEGEISEIGDSGGHVYFTLKDSAASLKVAFFKNYNASCKTRLSKGMKVRCVGRPELFANKGSFCFKAFSVCESGLGRLHEEYLRLKEKLEREGLFSASRKRPIPEFPKRVGVVTSAGGAVIRDIITTARSRFKGVSIVLSPALVQGEAAPASLISALRLLVEYGGIDVIIIGRGGGSFEDLSCFNDEALVREVAACEVPVISAVGHETDSMLVDFVADERAATPTAAAQKAVPDAAALARALDVRKKFAWETVGKLLRSEKDKLSLKACSLRGLRPSAMLSARMESLELARVRIEGLFNRIFDSALERLERAAVRLEERNPYRPLERGYAFVTDSRGRIVRSVGSVAAGERMSLRLADGRVDVVVEGASPGDIAE